MTSLYFKTKKNSPSGNLIRKFDFTDKHCTHEKVNLNDGIVISQTYGVNDEISKNIMKSIFEHYDNIQKDEYDKLFGESNIENKVYKIGDVFEDLNYCVGSNLSRYYILTSPMLDNLCFIGLKTGNRWSHQFVYYDDKYYIRHKDIQNHIPDHFKHISDAVLTVNDNPV